MHYGATAADVIGFGLIGAFVGMLFTAIPFIPHKFTLVIIFIIGGCIFGAIRLGDKITFARTSFHR